MLSRHPLVSTAFLLAGFLLVPLAMLAEDANNTVWQNRLFAPDYHSEPNHHTPVITEGIYLPSEITSSVTFTNKDSPLILTGTTYIAKNVTVTLKPGVTVVAHEYATLLVAGALDTVGSVAQPVTFTTNEVHPDNKNWNGILVASGGQVILRHTNIEYASPAMSCLPNSRLTGEHLRTRFGLVGLFTQSHTCTLTDSRLQAAQYGVIAIGVSPSIANVNISAGISSVKEVENHVRSF